MRPIKLLPVVLLFVAWGCGDDDSNTVNDPEPTTYEVSAATSWFVTSPDVDLSQFSSAQVIVTFTSDVAGDLLFNSSPQFQLWSHPDVYDFVLEGDVTINVEPSGTVTPGNTFSYDLTVDLADVPDGQTHIAIRPVDNMNFGTLGPSRISVFSSEVTFAP